MTRALLKAFVCGAAGALAWVLCEPFFPKRIPLGAITLDSRFTQVELIFTFLLGAFIGLAAGILNGRERGGRSNVLISAGLGLIFGAVGATFGHGIAGMVYVLLGGNASNGNMIARTFAFLPFGLLIGAAVGASQRSVRALVSGAIGGGLGGFVTGALFDPLSQMLSQLMLPAQIADLPPGFQAEAGAPGRAVLAFGLGLLIGLFTALVDLATRKAWLRLVLGRNEGREWPLDSAQTLIGRDERAHVPLFGDPSVPPLAAVIARSGNQYVLQDPGSPIGVGHNGVRVPQAVLSPGDTIQIGTLNFQFMMKAGGSAAAEGRAKAVPIGGQPQYSSPQLQYQPAQPLQPVQQPSAAPTGVYAAQPATAPQQAVVVTSGPLTGQRFAVQGVLEVGREGTGIGLAVDPQASRKHANISSTPAGLMVTDLGSTNGTYVNGQKVQTSALRSGDVVTIGSTNLRVE
ncbi:MAG: FHA domain-containing protein [Armatimonadetes bacterium]|nr:FHA domain-containing protein [Armatimonadota bacterium]